MFPADHLLPMARAAEAAGFDSITVPDSVFYPETVSADYPYSADGGRFWPADTPFVDPFISIAAMAAVTERIRFLTNVVKLPIRDPLMVAKQLSSMAVLSDERVALGVGLSWIPEEFTWTHTDMRTRGKRADEMIEIVEIYQQRGEGESPFSIDEIASLVHLEPRFHSLHIYAPDLAIRRDSNGVLFIAGIEVSSSGERGSLSDWILRQREMIVDARGLMTLSPFTGIALPNGLFINYPELEKLPGGFTYKTRQGRTRIYGGKVAENLCQAVARCIIGEQMLEIAKELRVVLTVHDAVACVVPEAQAEDAKAYIESCMSTSPKWAVGLPLSCESGMAVTYGDC